MKRNAAAAAAATVILARCVATLRNGCLPALLLGWLATAAHGAEMQVLHNHVPAAVKALPSLGRLPATNRLNLAIGLPLRNREVLTNLLREIYDPASPNYRHYLTPSQFAERFGPTEQDYQAVAAFAKAHGLTVTATHPNRMLLDVSGSVADVERATHVTMRVYRHPTERRNFYAPDTEPTLDLAVPVLNIGGLNDYSRPHPRLTATRIAPGHNATPNGGSGPNSTYMGGDFRAAYVPDSTLDGSGQTVGLLQFDGYDTNDIAYYESHAGIPSITLSNVLLDGFSGSPSDNGGEVEVSLDIEMAISMAPGLSQVIVYEAGPDGNWHDILNRMATDNLAQQLSCSWYQPGGAADPVADQIFQQMAAQGQSFFNASGDGDAYTSLIDFPCDSPYLTQVGGTTLTTSGPGGSWVSEKVWNSGGGNGSGGGVSTQYPIPGWQTNIDMTDNQGSVTMRNTPDVALTADKVYARSGGRDYNVGGTSCGAPLWAGFAALVNQRAAASGRPAVGFINPAIYVLGSSSNYTSFFHDITTGDNTSARSPTNFYAVAGYDLCTGWGTPAGQNLISVLANPEALLITPMTGFSSIGGVGGPFTVNYESLTLTNTGTNSLNWTLTNASPWLDVSPCGGTLTLGGPATIVAVSLNATASNLVVGTYSGMLWFTNQNDNVGQSLQFALSVISPPTITTQPADQAVLDGAAVTFTAGITGGLPLVCQWQVNGTNLVDGDNVSGSTTANLTINNVSAADVGTYTITVTNFAGVVVSSNAMLTITPSPPVIVAQPAGQTVIAGANVQFTVAAVGDKPFSYQWSFNTTNLCGETNATLILTNVQPAQAGGYSVLLTNVNGSTNSATAALTVLVPPAVVQSPASLTNLAGTTASFVIAACGTWPLNYQWRKNGANLNDGGNVSGTTTTTLTVTNVQDADAASYAVVITNVAGSITSSPAVLVVLDPPMVGIQPTNAVLPVGGNAVFTAITSGTPPLAWQWSFNGTNLADGGRISGSQSSLLTITNVLVGDTGNYQVVVTNVVGSATSAVAVLVVGVPPQIITRPANQSLPLGCDASFSVVAGGANPLNYQWWKDGAALGGQTNATLALTDIQTPDLGNYSVVVTNLFGSTTSSPALLAVGCHPPVAGADTIQRFAAGGVRVSAADLLANDIDTNGDSLTIIDVSSNSAAGGTVGLTNNWVFYTPPEGWTNGDSFTYTVSDGHCGTAVGTVTVQVVPDNPQPSDFAICNQGNNSLQLTFMGIPGNTYQIQYADCLLNPNWQVLTTQTADEFGLCQFVDSSLTNTSTRYYRAAAP